MISISVIAVMSGGITIIIMIVRITGVSTCITAGISTIVMGQVAVVVVGISSVVVSVVGRVASVVMVIMMNFSKKALNLSINQSPRIPSKPLS